MPGRANDLIAIPDSFWQRADTTTALRSHDMGRFFALLHQYTGASQTQIGIACVFSQGTVSDIIRGVQKAEKLDVFERIADGLAMPDPARITLGLAPRAPSRPATPPRARPIPTRDDRPARDANISELLSLDSEDRQEVEDPVRHRTFVGLTSASILGAVFTDPARSEPLAGGEPLAPILTSHASDTLPAPPSIATLTAATLMNGGHLAAAIDTASNQAARLDRDIPSGEAFAGLEVLLNGPPEPGNLDQRGQGDLLGGVAAVEG